MKEIIDPVKEVNRLSVLMIIYMVLYVAALILAIVAMSVGSGIPIIIVAVLCAAAAISLDIYVRTARKRLSVKLSADLRAAGIDPDELEYERIKNRKRK